MAKKLNETEEERTARHLKRIRQATDRCRAFQHSVSFAVTVMHDLDCLINKFGVKPGYQDIAFAAQYLKDELEKAVKEGGRADVAEN